MKIIITGGAGYIGSHALKILHAYGHETLVVDNLSTGHKEFIKWGDFEEVDICDLEKLKLIFNSYKADGILHFAASSIVSESFERPLKILENNIYGSLNVFEAMKYSGVKNIVFSSSCSVYGIPSVNPIKENTPKNPISPYGESKLFIENALDWFDKAKILKYVVLRYFNAAGADPDGEIGEDHINETHLIPIVLEVASGHRDKLIIYGADYPTPDGTCIRDYVHVSDLATAHLKALEYILDDGPTIALNLSNGNGFSVFDVVNATEKITGKTITLQIGDRRIGDPPILVGDPGLANMTLGWVANFKKLEDHIQHAWNWYQVHKLAL